MLIIIIKGKKKSQCTISRIQADDVGDSILKIINLYIKENKDLIPNELSFFKKWNAQRYYNAIQPIENEVVDSEKKNEKELLETKDPSMFYSKYPPDGFDLYNDLFKGLHFINYTFNHPSIDGGFAYVSSKKIIQKLESTDIETNTQIISSIISLDIVTYDVTIGDKKRILTKEKIQTIRNDLKRIYKNITKIKVPVEFTQENFIKHYFIILENEGMFYTNF